MVIRVHTEEGHRLSDGTDALNSMIWLDGLGVRTSCTEGTLNIGTPEAKLPKPPVEPHIMSEMSSSSPNSSFAFRMSASGDVEE